MNYKDGAEHVEARKSEDFSLLRYEKL